jgi:hypothetical protein
MPEQKRSYMQEVDEWLTDLLEGAPQEVLARVKPEIKQKLLESYRNGQAAGAARPFSRQKPTHN